jgi:hypothetical protein
MASLKRTLNTALEEHEFFNELCHLALSADKNVRFAGVVDNTGKLLTGRYRKDIRAPLFASSTESDVKSNMFYASYRSVALTRTFEPALGSLKYQLSEFNDVKLLTVPLTVRSDRFLCVSLDPAPSCQAAVTKLIDNI